jgi:hypothetical protein|tara:strand:+ start:322 stop:666 length:345 start_codon:yes stop_codon:yes gene_type:complete
MSNTVVYAWVHFARAPSELYLATTTDGTEKELVSQSAGASLGDVAGQVVTGIEAQVGDGSILTYLQITGSDGAQIINIKGGARGLGTNSNLNMCLQNMAIAVVRGQTLVVNTAD